MTDLIFFDFNHKSSVLLIFFFHAIVFSILLLKHSISENSRHSKWLAAFIFLGALYISPFMLGYANWYSLKGYKEVLFFLPLQQLLLIGPVFFFCVKSLVNKEVKFQSKDLLHFIPAIAYLVYSLVVFIGDKFVFEEFYFYATEKDKDLDFWYQMTGLISMLFYLFRSIKAYFNYRKQSLEEVSYADEVSFRWIKNFALAFALILVLRVLFFLLNPEWGEFGSKYWYYLSFSVLLLYISISGYSNVVKTSFGFYSNVSAKESTPINTAEERLNQVKSENDTIDPQLIQKIIRAFEQEEVYKKSHLTLTDLAQKLNTNRNSISGAINQEFEMNFNDFVNKKRTEAVIEKLQMKEHKNTTLLGIALDCGFNSKTTFNRAFKKYTGQTPKQFIAKNVL